MAIVFEVPSVISLSFAAHVHRANTPDSVRVRAVGPDVCCRRERWRPGPFDKVAAENSSD